MGIFLKTLKICNEVLGPIDYEKEGLNKIIERKDSCDIPEDTGEKPKGLSQAFYEFMTVDGDVASTDDSESENEKEEISEDSKEKGDK